MKKTIRFALILVLISLFTLLPFFRTDFFYTQDHIFVARLHQMHKALVDGQFPVRWSPDLRFGEPTFNFYAPLPYYIGGIFTILGMDIIGAVKLLFILSTVLSGLGMLIFLRTMFNNWSATAASILYVFAPYRAVDLYVRGALSESWAFIFFPLIFLTSLNLSKKQSLKNIILLSLSLAGLFLTHNVMMVIFLPFFMAWVLFLICKQKNLKLFYHFSFAIFLGFTLSASYLLPAFFERQFIQSQYLTLGHFNFRAHFVAVGQFFSTFWGYGSSLWGDKDGLSFQIGLVNWVIIVLSGTLAFLNKARKETVFLFVFLFASFLMSLFMQHNKSAFIWEAIPILAFIQFPWRFLGISIFLVSILGGLLVFLSKGRLYIPISIIFISVILNFNYFKPNQYVSYDFFDKFLKEESMQKGVDLTKDYLPIWVKVLTEEEIKTPLVDEGEVIIEGFERRSSSAYFNASVKTDSLITIPITYFPGWQIKVNDTRLEQNEPNEFGLINFNLSKGEYNVLAEFKDTFIRSIGNVISLISLFVIALILLKDKLKSILRYVK